MELLLLLGVLGLGGVAGLFDPLPSFRGEYSPPKYRTYTESRQYTKNTNCTENEIDRQNGRRKITPREEVVPVTEQWRFQAPKSFHLRSPNISVRTKREA